MSGFSAEELDAIPDDELVEAVLGVVWNSEGGRHEETLVKILEASPSGFGVVHSAWLLDAEIQNGGFHQYFWNHGRAYVEMTRRSLSKLGATEHLALFEKALVLLDREPIEPPDGAPEEVLQAFSTSAIASPMNALDSRWYDLPEIAAMLIGFLRAHPEEVCEEI